MSENKKETLGFQTEVKQMLSLFQSRDFLA